MKIPQINLSKQTNFLKQKLLDEYEKVLDSGQFILGSFVEDLENDLARYIGSDHAIGCNSGTDALLLALMALDIGPGDEVITSPFSFIASGVAIARTGAKPVFADIDKDTFLLDPSSVEAMISSKTRAIVPVHIFGQMADMEKFNSLARNHDLHLIEDAAQAIGASLGGKSAGTCGTIACFSFYPTKNLSAAGDAGMLTTSSEKLAARLRALRSHGEHKKYHHSEFGLNSRLSAMNAVTLQVKLEYLDTWIAKRQEIAGRYASEFAKRGLAPDSLTYQQLLPGAKHVYHQFTIQTDRRDALKEFLAEKGIGTAVHYPQVIYSQPCFDGMGYKTGLCPTAERLTETVLSLPLYPELDEAEVNYVINSIEEFFKQ